MNEYFKTNEESFENLLKRNQDEVKKKVNNLRELMACEYFAIKIYGPGGYLGDEEIFSNQFR